MLKNIQNLEGVSLLSKEEQKKVSGGEKCRTIEVRAEEFSEGLVGEGYSSHTCVYQCRPSFLGIGFGSWGETFERAC